MPDKEVVEGETSVIQSATTTSKSLRATIPQGIVKQFGLEEGQTLYWKIEFMDNQRAIVVKPSKADKSKRRTRATGGRMNF